MSNVHSIKIENRKMTQNSQCPPQSGGDQLRLTRRRFVPVAAAMGLGLFAMRE